MSNPTHRRWRYGTLAAAAALAACGGGDSVSIDGSEAARAQSALAKSKACEKRNNDSYDKLLECVTLRGVRAHQKKLQQIADANNGTRVSGTAGFDQSADYAAQVLRKAGYRVTRQEFEFQAFREVSPTVLEQTAPTPGPIETIIMDYSGSGDVTALVSQPAPSVDPNHGGVRNGCADADFAGFTAGHIALIKRGNCTFAIKATNAFNRGAVGVVIYNNIDAPLNGTLGEAFALDLPVTATTQAVGEALAAVAGLTLHVKTETFRGIAKTSNVLAESRGGNPNNVVMVGAHLDSVNEGPGINDNGSGSAAILETAVQMAHVRPRNKLRFALWGAEEANLLGSEHYVANLSASDLSQIALYLNFDMIGSPNPVYFVYDGDDSDKVGAGPGPSGSDVIEKTFENFYNYRGVPFKGTDFDGRSDYGPFMDVGIPAGGLFTGAEGIKTAAEAALWGGTAGQAYDPCYHQACDTYGNVNTKALDLNADAVAYSTLRFAMSTAGINGKTAARAAAPAPAGSKKWSSQYPRRVEQ